MSRGFLLWLCACIVIAAYYIPQAWELRLLYTDAHIREHAEASLRYAAETNGWLLSELSLRDITHTGATLWRTIPARGVDPVECYHITDFHETTLTPCAK